MLVGNQVKNPFAGEPQPRSKDTPYPRLLLFDLSVGGHHPSYLLYLIQHWCEQGLAGQLDIVVTPTFLQRHSDVVVAAQAYGVDTVRFIAITPEETAQLSDFSSALSRATRAFKEWRLFCQYARQYQANHGLLMYFDTAQVPFIFGPPSPCQVSGIYFRPTLHYHRFQGFQPGLKGRIQALRERFNLSRVLRHAKLDHLFCLDPFISDYLKENWQVDKAVTLADPVKVDDLPEAEVNRLKQSLGVLSGRQVFLMFGALTRRKGIDQVLDALSRLSPLQSQQICLLMAGSLGADAADNARLKSRLATLNATSLAQVILVDRFITDDKVQAYFGVADIVLATYQQHVGMSGILNRAALAGKPVICSDYGLMGELTRRFQLGLAIDASDPESIAQAMVHCLDQPPTSLADPEQMQAFGEHSSAEKFAQVIFNALLGPGATVPAAVTDPIESSV